MLADSRENAETSAERAHQQAVDAVNAAHRTYNLATEQMSLVEQQLADATAALHIAQRAHVLAARTLRIERENAPQ